MKQIKKDQEKRIYTIAHRIWDFGLALATGIAIGGNEHSIGLGLISGYVYMIAAMLIHLLPPHK